jgi:hypothetical protein
MPSTEDELGFPSIFSALSSKSGEGSDAIEERRTSISEEIVPLRSTAHLLQPISTLSTVPAIHPDFAILPETADGLRLY